MPILGFAHVNVSTQDLEKSRKFYAEILGLVDGYRPPFGRVGAWMYLGDQPIVHISTSRNPTPQPKKTDAFDHLALWTKDIHHYRETLNRHGIKFVEFGVPENDQYQLFFKDPDGTEIELIFSGEEARLASQAEGAHVDGSFGRNL
ncbi:glyoxalase [Polynucleobacter sp. SHI8]|uniref:VOC family protein n=1 Tax=unclassified Polynucleobacter TaxID=2640945 RepID=UPI00249068C6|nr:MULTISPECIES: VOC family protein [unclassified Polynucleobacter]BDW11034.1 glyoxalase [Polynucleobacter sp. SHI2]BDW13480.1 glyoxalase [Polynucleobacter sp. SHI8]